VREVSIDLDKDLDNQSKRVSILRTEIENNDQRINNIQTLVVNKEDQISRLCSKMNEAH
jgi:hypothetical protein